jgi:hypothetical protein
VHSKVFRIKTALSPTKLNVTVELRIAAFATRRDTIPRHWHAGQPHQIQIQGSRLLAPSLNRKRKKENHWQLESQGRHRRQWPDAAASGLRNAAILEVDGEDDNDQNNETNRELAEDEVEEDQQGLDLSKISKTLRIPKFLN